MYDVCWLACEGEDTWLCDLHVGPQRALDGSEDNVVSLSGLVTPACRCAGRALTHTRLLLRLYIYM